MSKTKSDTPRTDAVCKEIENSPALLRQAGVEGLSLEETAKLVKGYLTKLRDHARLLEHELNEAKADTHLCAEHGHPACPICVEDFRKAEKERDQWREDAKEFKIAAEAALVQIKIHYPAVKIQQQIDSCYCGACRLERALAYHEQLVKEIGDK